MKYVVASGPVPKMIVEADSRNEAAEKLEAWLTEKGRRVTIEREGGEVFAIFDRDRRHRFWPVEIEI